MKFRAIAILATALGSCALAAHSQTWVTVAPESSTTCVTLPAGTTYDLGDTQNNKWSLPTQVKAATTLCPMTFPSTGVFPFEDPDIGTLKVLRVLEIPGASQSVGVTDNSVTPAAVTQKLIPPAPPTQIPVQPGASYVLTVSQLDLGAGTVHLVLDGVTFVCQLQSAAITETILPLNCTVGGN